nr:hypothetical protein [Tanacetum cinerariifolium]
MSSIDTYSTTKDLVFDEFMASYRSDELRFEVFFGSCFFFYPLDYSGGQILYLRLPSSKMLSYKETNDLLLDKTKEAIWKWFIVNPNVVLKKSDEEVTSIYRSHEKARKVAITMSLEELIAWEQEEAHSLSYLRSPHVWQRTLDINGKGNVLLDDFEAVGNGKGKVLLDDFKAVGNGKDKVACGALEDVGKCKDKVLLDDLNDGLISTKGDGRADICQTGRIHKLRNFKDDPTQEYIRKLIDDGSEDDDIKRRPWVTALEFINNGGEIEGGCFGDIKSYLKNEKLEKVVAIIAYYTPNVIGDMNATLKDPSCTMSGTVHYKVLLDDGYAKDIKVGSALILRNVYVFCPKSSNYALNITLINLFKIFQKGTVVEDANGASGSNI